MSYYSQPPSYPQYPPPAGAMPPRSRPPPPPRHDASSDDDLSDLSDPDDNLPITSLGAQPRRPPPPQTADSDDDSHEDEEEEEENESDDATESDAEEDSYASADSDADSSSSGPPKTAIRGAALISHQRAQAKSKSTPKSSSSKARRKPTSNNKVRTKAAPAPNRGARTSPRQQRTSLAAATSATSPRSTRLNANSQTSTTQPPGAVPIKLKIRKDRLRAATSDWTPEPGTADSSPSMAPTPAPRSRKNVIPESDSEEDDEELDDEEEDEEEEEEEEDVMMEDAGDIDEEGEEDDELLDEDAEGETDEEMADGGGGGGMDGTRGDMSKMTNRQRTRVGGITADLMELPSGYGKSKAAQEVTLSVAEQELKRAEMARRRKHLTDQRLHEEKMDTINRLLKKQTPKMRGSRGTVGEAGTPAGRGGDGALAEAPPPPTMVRWISDKDGVRLGVPESWMQAGPVGEVFKKQEATPRMRKLVEEI